MEAINYNNQEAFTIVEEAIAKIAIKIARLNNYLRVVQQQIKIDKIVDKTNKRVYNQTSIDKA